MWDCLRERSGAGTPWQLSRSKRPFSWLIYFNGTTEKDRYHFFSRRLIGNRQTTPRIFQAHPCSERLSCPFTRPVFSQDKAYSGLFCLVKWAQLPYDAREGGNQLAKVETLYHSTAGQACAYSCPAQIDIDEVVASMRDKLYQAGSAPESLLRVRDNILRISNVYVGAKADRI